jgi:hypothetical protein
MVGCTYTQKFLYYCWNDEMNGNVLYFVVADSDSKSNLYRQNLAL